MPCTETVQGIFCFSEEKPQKSAAAEPEPKLGERRRVFLLSRTTGLKNREIAERLNISVKTVEKHIGAALSQLRLRLSRSGFLRLFL
jgi:RNA polymerase sigma-70 factor (ECF subfamily)